jgi:hypothetical protein
MLVQLEPIWNDQALSDQICARVCAQDAAGRVEMGETQRTRHERPPSIRRGKRGDQRRRGTAETRVVWLIAQRPVDPLQRRGARYEDTTVIPARLTLLPLVGPLAGGALGVRGSQPRVLSPFAVRWSSWIAAVRASSSDRAGTSTVRVGSAARSALPCW